jgi:hypothetical protein
MDSRKIIDCRKISGSSCSIAISGTEEEIVPLALYHAITVHGHTDTPELEGEIRSALENEVMYV